MTLWKDSVAINSCKKAKKEELEAGRDRADKMRSNKRTNLLGLF